MRGFKGTGTIVSAIVLLMSTLTGGTALGASPKGDYVYQDGPLPPLKDARVYVLEGIPSQDGCTYQYPSLTVGPNETARMQRDIGIDSVHCRKLVEEGIPTEIDTATADTSYAASVGAAPENEGLTTIAHSGYVKIWYTDLPGYTTTGDTTYINWGVSNGCAVSGSASGEWTWRTGTGWNLLYSGGTDSLTCARYKGRTWSAMLTTTFILCYGTAIYTYYDYVDAFGWSDGSFTGDWNSRKVMNGCPFDLFEQHLVNKTA